MRPTPSCQHRRRRTPGPHDGALDDLRFIRETMERSGAFTAVPGTGWVIIGGTAIIAAVIGSRTTTPLSFVGVWMAEAALALAIGLTATMRRARQKGVPLTSGPGRRFIVGLTTPLVAGGVLTFALFTGGAQTALPGMWLLLYGTAFTSGGAFTVRLVPIAGLCFIATGTAALLSPPEYGNVFMAGGFGGLHLLFGLLVARRHGG